MRTLITGGAGHVGQVLAATLRAQGRDALLLDRVQPSVEGFEGIAVDVADRDAMAQILRRESFSFVFHLAGLGASAPRTEIDRVNIGGTAAVLDAARDARVVVMSSSAVYGAATEEPITEATALTPVGAYGASKVAAEGLANAAAARGEWIAIARPFNIVGPGQRAPLLPSEVASQIAAIERGTRPPVLTLGYLGNSRDFVDARDVAAGLLVIAEKGMSGEAYNICTGIATKARDLVEMLVARSFVPVTIQDKTVAGASDVARQCGSYAKLKQLSGWHPEIPLVRALAESLDSWRAEYVNAR